jgi:hypothetical protein
LASEITTLAVDIPSGRVFLMTAEMPQPCHEVPGSIKILTFNQWRGRI